MSFRPVSAPPTVDTIDPIRPNPTKGQSVSVTTNRADQVALPVLRGQRPASSLGFDPERADRFNYLGSDKTYKPEAKRPLTPQARLLSASANVNRVTTDTLEEATVGLRRLSDNPTDQSTSATFEVQLHPGVVKTLHYGVRYNGNLVKGDSKVLKQQAESTKILIEEVRKHLENAPEPSQLDGIKNSVKGQLSIEQKLKVLEQLGHYSIEFGDYNKLTLHFYSLKGERFCYTFHEDIKDGTKVLVDLEKYQQRAQDLVETCLLKDETFAENSGYNFVQSYIELGGSFDHERKKRRAIELKQKEAQTNKRQRIEAEEQERLKRQTAAEEEARKRRAAAQSQSGPGFIGRAVNAAGSMAGAVGRAFGIV